MYNIISHRENNKIIYFRYKHFFPFLIFKNQKKENEKSVKTFLQYQFEVFAMFGIPRSKIQSTTIMKSSKIYYLFNFFESSR